MAIDPQSVAVEDQRANHGLGQIVAHRHTSYRRKRGQPFIPRPLLDEQDDGRDVEQAEGWPSYGARPSGRQFVVGRWNTIWRSGHRDKHQVAGETHDQPPPHHFAEERQVRGDILENPASPGVQSKQEHAEDVRSPVDKLAITESQRFQSM